MCLQQLHKFNRRSIVNHCIARPCGRCQGYDYLYTPWSQIRKEVVTGEWLMKCGLLVRHGAGNVVCCGESCVQPQAIEVVRVTIVFALLGHKSGKRL